MERRILDALIPNEPAFVPPATIVRPVNGGRNVMDVIRRTASEAAAWRRDDLSMIHSTPFPRQRLARIAAHAARAWSIRDALRSPDGVKLLRAMVRALHVRRGRIVVKTRLRKYPYPSGREHEWHLDGARAESSFYMTTHGQRVPQRVTISACVDESMDTLVDCGTEFLSNVPRVRIGRVRRMAQALEPEFQVLTVAEREAYVAQTLANATRRALATSCHNTTRHVVPTGVITNALSWCFHRAPQTAVPEGVVRMFVQLSTWDREVGDPSEYTESTPFFVDDGVEFYYEL